MSPRDAPLECQHAFTTGRRDSGGSSSNGMVNMTAQVDFPSCFFAIPSTWDPTGSSKKCRLTANGTRLLWPEGPSILVLSVYETNKTKIVLGHC